MQRPSITHDMAGGTWKKVTFGTLLVAIISLITWVALHVAKKKQGEENTTLNTAWKLALATWIVCFAFAAGSGVVWATKRGGGQAAAAAADDLGF